MTVLLGLAGLASAGVLVSLYFTLVYYRVISPDAAIVPRFCRLKEESCNSILRTREARPLGIPNPVLGLAFYGLLIVLTIRPDMLARVYGVMLLVSGATVVFGAYLTYSLLVKLRVPCGLCLTSHAINLTLFLLLLAL